MLINRLGSWRLSCVAMGFASLVWTPSFAQTTKFDGGGDGTNWTDAFNWDLAEPNGPSFDAVIDGASSSPFDVQIGTSRVVDTITIGDKDILRLLNAKNLEVGSQIDNVGTFRIVSSVSATILQIENAVDMIGGGSVVLEGSAARIADNLGALNTGHLTTVDNTISGRGSIGLNRTQLRITARSRPILVGHS